MSLWSRIQDWADAPRFCRDCGRPIEVEDLEAFDEKTGETKERWVWHCPEVYAGGSPNQIVWSQSGDVIHPYGHGRPRWHRLTVT